jgi:hypothetical protein
MAHCAKDEEEEKNDTYWNVDSDRRYQSKPSMCGRIRRRHVHLPQPCQYNVVECGDERYTL